MHKAVSDPEQAAAPPAGPLGREALPLLHLHEGLHTASTSQHPQDAGPPRQGVPAPAAAVLPLLGRRVRRSPPDTDRHCVRMRLEPAALISD